MASVQLFSIFTRNWINLPSTVTPLQIGEGPGVRFYNSRLRASLIRLEISASSAASADIF